MVKYLYPQLNWDCVKAVGFDLDGTLYDEFEFIRQVYYPIANILTKFTGCGLDTTYTKMLQRWIEKGSSYNRLFDDILIEVGLSADQRLKAIDCCVHEFRNFQPQLRLTTRVEKILDLLNDRFPLFLITDGGEKLQQNKLNALGLTRWIDQENIAISGRLAGGISKPDIRMSLPVKLLQKNKRHPQSIVYFGDRDVDAKFADNCGYQFMRVNVMMPLL